MKKLLLNLHNLVHKLLTEFKIAINMTISHKQGFRLHANVNYELICKIHHINYLFLNYIILFSFVYCTIHTIVQIMTLEKPIIKHCLWKINNTMKIKKTTNVFIKESC